MDPIKKTLVYMLVPVPEDEEFIGNVIAFDTMKMQITVKAESQDGNGEERIYYLEPYDEENGKQSSANPAKAIDVVEGIEIEMPYKIDQLANKKISVKRRRVKLLEVKEPALEEIA